MLYRFLPAMLSFALPWIPPGCSYDPDDGGHGAGGKNVGGLAGAVSGNGGAGADSGGAGASSGGAGASSGGAGASSGGAGASSGGAGADSGGAGADSGGAGASSGGIDAGGTAGTGGLGVPQGSFTLSSGYLFFGRCAPPPQELIITNTSSFDLTWHATAMSSPNATFNLTPPSSTLAAGEAVSVAVRVTVTSPQDFKSDFTHVSIDADVAPPQDLVLFFDTTGRWYAPLPPDVDFGNVPKSGPLPQVFIPVKNQGETLSSSNSSFHVDRTPQRPGSWIITFWPSSAGPGEVTGLEESTFTFGTQLYGANCLPNSFKARGVGVLP